MTDKYTYSSNYNLYQRNHCRTFGI